MSSTASDLASGSQDLAALLGLFCTDGVERNSLAYNFGWGTVVASSISLIGVLGLVKSSIKVALGLRYCQQAGFNLDSIRGIFGYLPGESPVAGCLMKCHVATAKISGQGMSIKKEKRYLSGANTPIVNINGNPTNLWDHQLVINLGNIKEEQDWRHNPIIIIIALIVCSGATSWLLEIVYAQWTWVKIVAIPGLHVCLVLLVGLPLYYDRLVNLPAKYMTVGTWDIINSHGSSEHHLERTLHLLQVDYPAHGKDILHLRGNTTFIDTYAVKGCLLFLSIFAAVAYICQYAIIKAASSTRALVWLGCQGALAGARLAYWILDPSFDDSTVLNSELARINVTGSPTLTMSELICNFEFDSQTLHIPAWALTYLLTHSLREVLHQAATRTQQHIVAREAKFCILIGVNIGRIIRRRWIDENDDAHIDYRLALCMQEDGSITPLVLIGVGYETMSAGTRHGKGCYMEAQWPPRLSGAEIHSTCTLFAVDDKSEQRLHLRSSDAKTCDDSCLWDQNHTNDWFNQDSWKFLADRSRICKFLNAVTCDNSFDTKMTPGWEKTVNVEGADSKPHTHRAPQRPWEEDYQTGIQKVREYLAKGVSKRWYHANVPNARSWRRRWRASATDAEETKVGGGKEKRPADLIMHAV